MGLSISIPTSVTAGDDVQVKVGPERVWDSTDLVTANFTYFSLFLNANPVDQNGTRSLPFCSLVNGTRLDAGGVKINVPVDVGPRDSFTIAGFE